MTVHEKLERLTQFSNLSAVSKEAKLGVSTLANILRRDTDISVSTARSLARVLNVDLGWLVDDSMEWPPVRTESRPEPSTRETAAA